MREHPIRTCVMVGAALAAAVLASVLATPAAAAPSRFITDRQLAAMPADYTPDALYAVEAQRSADHALEHHGERNQARRLVAEGKIVQWTRRRAGSAGRTRWVSGRRRAGASSAQAIGVHAILFHTGKVLLFGGYVDANDNTLETDAFLYDPIDGRAKEVDPPHNTFCAGEVLLQDGTLLVVGGRLANTHPTPGTPYVLRFDPVQRDVADASRTRRWVATTRRPPNCQMAGS